MAFILLFSTTLIFGHMIKIAELPYFRQEKAPELNDAMDNYFNAIWLSIITMTTVGYGDLTPYTQIGRALMIVLCIWGSFVLALFTIMMKEIFEMNNFETMALIQINYTR